MSSKYVISKDSIQVARSPNPSAQNLFQVKVTGEDREQRTFYAEYTIYRWRIVIDQPLRDAITEALETYVQDPRNFDEFDALRWRFYGCSQGSERPGRYPHCGH